MIILQGTGSLLTVIVQANKLQPPSADTTEEFNSQGGHNLHEYS